MTRVEKIFLWVGNALSGLTGLVLLWVQTFYRAPLPEHEFDLVALSHPWQGWMQHLHIWTAPVLVVAIGMVWYGHGVFSLALKKVEGKRTGWILLLVAAPMIVSGYAIGTSVSELARSVWVWVHLAACGVWLAAFLGHTVFRKQVVGA